MGSLPESRMPNVASSKGKPARKAEVVLVGCGAVAELLYAKALRKLEEEGVVSTSAVVDPNPARTSSVAASLRGARQFASLAAALAEVKPDLAIIATPHRWHADLVVSCLTQSISVLCEKPLAITVAECDRMIEAAQRAARVLAVGHFRRFFPSCQMVRAILGGGLLGEVRSFHLLEGDTYSWPAQSGSFFRRVESGGGVLIDAGSHTIDLLLWWLGDVAEFNYQDDAMGGVEANCILRLRMRSGVTGTVQLSRDWPLPNRYVIECERGWLAYSCDVVDRLEWGLYGSAYGLNTEIRMMRSMAGPPCHQLGAAGPGFVDCFVNQLRNVLAAATTGEELCVSAMDARRTVALIEDCYRKRELLEMPWLEPAEVLRASGLTHV
jgi:predicted dehydrogenase